MPKAKPTQVIVHRIELQEKERDMLETLVISKATSNVASAVNDMLKPVITGVAAYTAYMSAKALHGFVDDELGDLVSRGWNWFVYGDDDKFFFWNKPKNKEENITREQWRDQGIPDI